jgi:hypothetical protein
MIEIRDLDSAEGSVRPTGPLRRRNIYRKVFSCMYVYMHDNILIKKNGVRDRARDR